MCAKLVSQGIRRSTPSQYRFCSDHAAWALSVPLTGLFGTKVRIGPRRDWVGSALTAGDYRLRRILGQIRFFAPFRLRPRLPPPPGVDEPKARRTGVTAPSRSRVPSAMASGQYRNRDVGGHMQLFRHRKHAHDTAGYPRGRLMVFRPGWRRAAILSGAVVAVVATPVALAGSLANAGGQPVRGGVKNPPSGGYYQTTQIWANNASWGTRQSNLGTGGTDALG